MEKIKEEINKCLNCKNKPCSNGCPVHTDIPTFIRYIKDGNISLAKKVLLDNNIFSNICSYVCPQENQCEGSCVGNYKQNPVRIGALEKYVNENCKDEYVPDVQPKNNIRVAIIGSGPASLSCAYELAKKGYCPTIFEKQEKLGGILRYGIPSYRLNKEILDDTINNILKTGIEYKTNCEFGKNITLEELKKEYKAIYLGIGAHKPCIYKLSENNFENIYDSDDFLKRFYEGSSVENLGDTVVIGGGNVAIDCARTAIRMGAKSVRILYRRARENMPARDIEIIEALEDGVELITLTKVISASGEKGKLSTLECLKTNVINEKAVDIKNSNFTTKANSLIFAIGLSPEIQLIEEIGLETVNGLVVTNENGMTSIDGIFAGGDLINSKSTVCKAIASGKIAANGIEKYLKI